MQQCSLQYQRIERDDGKRKRDNRIERQQASAHQRNGKTDRIARQARMNKCATYLNHTLPCAPITRNSEPQPTTSVASQATSSEQTTIIVSGLRSAGYQTGATP